MPLRIHFNSQNLVLEGRLTRLDPLRAVIVMHPHPLYGGEMNNPVVGAVAGAYRKKGWSTLCFNFRGAGASQGDYDEGRGEQADIDAAIAFLREQGFIHIDLAGYSFGAWVLARWSQRDPLHGHAIRLVAPPVAFLDFSGIAQIGDLKQVVVGERDDFAPPAEVERHLHIWNPRAALEIIPESDHFFGGRLLALEQAIAPA